MKLKKHLPTVRNNAPNFVFYQLGCFYLLDFSAFSHKVDLKETTPHSSSTMVSSSFT